MSYSSGFYCLQVIRQHNYILQDMNGLTLAVLDRKTTSALKYLDERFQLQYWGFISIEQWEKCSASSRSASKAAVVDVELNISGPRAAGRATGKILSQAGMYIQHPRFRPMNMPYENPHYIVLVDAESCIQQPDIKLQPEQSVAEVPSVQDILEDLDQRRHLNLTRADDMAIRTELQLYVC